MGSLLGIACQGIPQRSLYCFVLEIEVQLMYNIIQVIGIQYSDTQFLKIIVHFQLLENIDYISHVVITQYYSLFYT